MKKLLMTTVALASMSAFSQSYLVLNNGVTLTTDKAGFVYDFNHFVQPYKVKYKGGNFLIEDERLATIDENGFLYKKDTEVKKLQGHGRNYFLTESGFFSKSSFYTVDTQGYVYEFKDENSVFKKAKTFGGNYLVVENELYTVDAKGLFKTLKVSGVNPSAIKAYPGNYFVSNTGVVHTVSSEGFVFAKPEMRVDKISKAGGNFFIDSSNTLYTVTDEGYLLLPALPASLKVNKIRKLGSNYFVDSEGKLFTVDKNGVVQERAIDAHQLNNLQVLSL